MKKRSSVVSFLLAVAIVFSSIAPIFARESITDMPKGWSKEYMEAAVDNGILIGDNGKVRPSDNMTRAEFVTVISRILGLSEKGDVSQYTDVKPGDWYYDDIARAVEAGLVDGRSSTKMEPNGPIKREEAFTIMARMLLLSEDKNHSDIFADSNKISDWAKPSINALAKGDYIEGNDYKQLKPRHNITREEMSALIYRLIDLYVDEDLVGKEVEGNVIVNDDIAKIKDSVIHGDLILGEGVDVEEVKLNNVKVHGRIIVRSDADLKLINGCEINHLKATDKTIVKLDEDSEFNKKNEHIVVKDIETEAPGGEDKPTPEKPEDKPEETPEAPLPEIPTKPEETPEKPEETPEKPEETPEKPEETPEKPEETPEKPEETPEKPEETPEKPEETPEKPEETPEKPEETPEKPEEIPEKPEETPGGEDKPLTDDKKEELINKSLDNFDELSLKEQGELLKDIDAIVDSMEKDLSDSTQERIDLANYKYNKDKNLSDKQEEISKLEKQVEEAKERLEKAEDNLAEAEWINDGIVGGYEEGLKEAQKEYDEAKEALEDAKKELEEKRYKYQIELVDATKEEVILEKLDLIEELLDNESQTLEEKLEVIESQGKLLKDIDDIKDSIEGSLSEFLAEKIDKSKAKYKPYEALDEKNQAVKGAQTNLEEAEKLVKEAKERLEKAEDNLAEAEWINDGIVGGYEEGLKEAQEEYDKAKKALEDSKDTLANAQEELEKAKDEFQIELVDTTKEEIILEKLESLDGKTLKEQKEILKDIDNIAENINRDLKEETKEKIEAAKEKIDLIEEVNKNENLEENLNKVLSILGNEEIEVSRILISHFKDLNDGESESFKDIERILEVAQEKVEEDKADRNKLIEEVNKNEDLEENLNKVLSILGNKEIEVSRILISHFKDLNDGESESFKDIERILKAAQEKVEEDKADRNKLIEEVNKNENLEENLNKVLSILGNEEIELDGSLIDAFKNSNDGKSESFKDIERIILSAQNQLEDINNRIKKAEKNKAELVARLEQINDDKDSLESAETKASIIGEETAIINARIDKFLLEGKGESEEYKNLVSEKKLKIDKLNRAMEDIEKLKNYLNKKDNFLTNLENISSTNKELYSIEYTKDTNSVEVNFLMDSLLTDQVTPVLEAAKDFINTIFESDELNIMEVEITNYNLIFENKDDDPVIELATNLLSTITEEEGTPVEVAFDGLLNFLNGTDVNEKLNLDIKLVDGTVLKIEEINAKFTRDRILSEEELGNLN